MSKFKVGDAVQLTDKPFDEYSGLVTSLPPMFAHMIAGIKLIVEKEADEYGDYFLRHASENKPLWLNEIDIEPWEGIY